MEVIRKSPSYPELLENWKRFVKHLGVKKIQGINLQSAENPDIPCEIIRNWSAHNENATFGDLCDALTNCKLKDISELLKRKFWRLPINSLKIDFHVKGIDLKKILGKVSRKTYQRIYNALKEYPADQPIRLVKEDVIPKEHPNYYIPRSISRMTQVDERIFQSNLNDHLLVKGISKTELEKHSNNNKVETSGNQLNEVTASLIVLERDEHFYQICLIASHPVHLIEKQSNAFLWVRSVGGMHKIYCYLRESKDIYSEDEIMNVFTNDSYPRVFITSASPGMGKTWFLENMAAKVQARNASIVLILKLDDIGNVGQPIKTLASAISAILEYSCPSAAAKIILEQVLFNTTFTVDLFIDSYDGVSMHKINIADTFLKTIKEFKKFRLFVATKPHRRLQLESILNVISYEILPFDESSRIQFLSSYWNNLYGEVQKKTLAKYAKECLETLQIQIADQEYFGIPLHCKMLANVFTKDATNFSKLDSDSGSKINVAALWEVYEQNSQLKKVSFDCVSWKTFLTFWKFGSVNIKLKYAKFHVFESMMLLFPNWVGAFKPHLEGFSKIDENKIYSIGLLVANSYKNTRSFVHITYAKFLLAKYLVTNMRKLIKCTELLLEIILGTDRLEKICVEHGPVAYKWKDPVIPFFVNMCLKDQLKISPADNLVSIILPMIKTIPLTRLCEAMLACIQQGFENLFDVLRSLAYIIHVRFNTSLGEEYFKFLPHLAVHSFNSVKLVEMAIKFTKDVIGMNLNHCVYETSEQTTYPWISGASPLHVAVYHGNYTIVKYLVQEYGNQIAALNNLLHMSAYQSTSNSEQIIAEKLSFMDQLLKISEKYNLNWLEETFQERTPLLEDEVDFRILLKFVEAGANINACSAQYGTVLHTSRNIKRYIDLVCLALSRGFNAVNVRDYRGQTPLMLFLSKLKRHNIQGADKILELFKKAGANFNAEDVDGNSVLLHALKNSETSVEVISQIVDYGANVNHQNAGKNNAAHLIRISYKNLDSPEALIKLNLIISKGFNMQSPTQHKPLEDLVFHNVTIPIDSNEELNSTECLLEQSYSGSLCSNLQIRQNEIVLKFDSEESASPTQQKTMEDVELCSVTTPAISSGELNSTETVLDQSNSESLRSNMQFHEKDFVRKFEETTSPPQHKSMEDFELCDEDTPNVENEELNSTETLLAQSSSVRLRSNMQTHHNKIVRGSKLIGEGYFSEVYQGKLGDRNVAVKMMKVLRSEVENVEREIKILINCDNHENIVRYFCESHKESKNKIKYFLAMELCESTLKEYIQENANLERPVESSSSAIDILRQTTEGLFHLHNLKEPIIHRDLKPENILLKFRSGQKVVKLADFGTSKAILQGKTHHTTKNFAGTLEWMAPELLDAMFSKQKFANLTTKSDIFSLGCIFYYVLSNGLHPLVRTPSSKSEYEPKLEACAVGDNNLHLNMFRLILFMISFNENERPYIGSVKNHPIFWSAERRLLFLTESFDLSSKAELAKIEKWLITNYQQMAGDSYSNLQIIFISDREGKENGWLDCVSENVRDALPNKKSKNPKTNYRGDSFVDLLTAMRNLKAHIREKDACVHEELWKSPEDYLNYWQAKGRFPILFDFIWTAFQSIKNPLLRRYYEEVNFDFTKIIKDEVKFVV